MISSTLNDDVTYSVQPLEMRNQRTYAIKVGALTQRVIDGSINKPRQGLTGFLTSRDSPTRKRVRMHSIW